MGRVHQLLAGRDFATAHSSLHLMAAQMANYVYLVETEANAFVVVDPAWDVEGILAHAKTLGLQRVVGAVFTHRHLDHTGGNVHLQREKVVVPGLAHFVQHKLCPVFVGSDDVEATARQTGVAISSIKAISDGMELFGGVIKVLHTPGHTPGSVCLLVDDKHLISGDTLFIGSCGRVDLAESDPDQMESSLVRLSKYPDSVSVLPGHNYASAPTSTIATERATNVMMRQAMASLRTPQATSALETVRLPDYLEAAYAALLQERKSV